MTPAVLGAATCRLRSELRTTFEATVLSLVLEHNPFGNPVSMLHQVRRKPIPDHALKPISA